MAGQIRADRQTLMFSATWPSAIQRLAMDFLCTPARVTIGSKDLSASHSIAQVNSWLDVHCLRVFIDVQSYMYYAVGCNPSKHLAFAGLDQVAPACGG